MAIQLFGALVITGLLLYLLYISIMQLRLKHAGYVRAMWYMFSFAGCMTLVVGCWANEVGAFDAQGKPQGRIGEFIMNLIPIILDVNHEAELIFTVVFLVVAPQFLSYILSGVFGCAEEPVFVNAILTFATWFLAKSFATVSAVFFTIAPFAAFSGWPNFGALNSLRLILLAIFAVSVSFGILLFHYEADALLAEMSRQFPKLGELLKRIHRRATKYSQGDAMFVTPMSVSTHQIESSTMDDRPR